MYNRTTESGSDRILNEHDRLGRDVHRRGSQVGTVHHEDGRSEATPVESRDGRNHEHKLTLFVRGENRGTHYAEIGDPVQYDLGRHQEDPEGAVHGSSETAAS